MRTWIVTCCLGIILVGYLPRLPSLLFLLPLGGVFLLSLWLKKAAPGIKYISLKTFGALSFGFSWAIGYGWFALQQALPAEYEGQVLQLTGVVAGMPRDFGRYQRFDFQVADAAGLPVKRVRLNWYHSPVPLEPGQRWRLKVKLKRPHGFANPGGLDYESWLFREGIAATGYVRKDRSNQQLNPGERELSLDLLRHRIKTAVQVLLQDYEHGGLILALLMGERSGVSGNNWQLFTATGTNHLFVISGLHVGFVALCSYSLILVLARLLLLGVPRIAAQQIAGICVLFACTGYAALAGFSLPTQRALIMLLVVVVGRLVRRQVNPWDSYCLALLLVLLWSPLSAEGTGFWLSFGAVAALIYGFSGWSGLPPKVSRQGVWWRWIRPQWVIFVAFTPMLLLCFQQFSLVAPLANSFSVPVVGLLLVPVCLLAGGIQLIDDTPARWLFGIADSLLDWLLGSLRELGANEWSTLSLMPSELALAVAVPGILILLAPRGLPARWLGLFYLSPLFFSGPEGLSDGDYRVTFLDVGQGLSVLVETGGHALVYDVGPRFSERFDAAGAVILPYLRTRGIHRLDRVVVSHNNNDHAGGLASLLAGVEVSSLVLGFRHSGRVRQEAEDCISERRWQWEGVEFELLQAQLGPGANENNRSCVLRVSNGHFSLLLTGDIEIEAETFLIKQYGEKLKAELLLVPHHGSRTSSSLGFLQQVAPDYAVFTTGYRNRFGHPHRAVLNRYRQRGVMVFRTQDSGAVTFSVRGDGGPISITKYRDSRQRYWHE